ncbi:MAG: hypothetical protein FWF78_07015 [Defluviitaleaceae bacterium]|nr:hypothetical protein [Defluviitaleaceae bacterium]
MIHNVTSPTQNMTSHFKATKNANAQQRTISYAVRVEISDEAKAAFAEARAKWEAGQMTEAERAEFVRNMHVDLFNEGIFQVPNGRAAFSDMHYLDPALSAATNNEHFLHIETQFTQIMFQTFLFKGLENGFQEFIAMRGYLESRFEGEELAARLRALDNAFVNAGDAMAYAIAGNLTRLSPYYTMGDMSLTKVQIERNEKIEQEANRLIEHMGNMFRAALEFFHETGSFDGFLDSPEANPPGMPSMRDAERLPAFVDWDRPPPPTHAGIINTPGLSEAGRGFLERFFEIGS